MASFIAECPTGHKGTFVTNFGWHICHCGFQILEFNPVSMADITNKKIVLLEKLVNEYKEMWMEERATRILLVEEALFAISKRLAQLDPNFTHGDFV